MTNLSSARNNPAPPRVNFKDKAVMILAEIEVFDTSHLCTQDLDFIERSDAAGFVSEGAYNALQRLLHRLQHEEGRRRWLSGKRRME